MPSLLSLAESGPLPFGNFLAEPLHLLIAVDRLANTILPWFGNVELARLSLVALDQIEGAVELAARTTAIRFPAAEAAGRQRPAHPALGMSNLSDPGAAPALGIGQA